MINAVKIAIQFLLRNKKILIQAGLFVWQNRDTVVFYYKKQFTKKLQDKK